MIESQRVVQRSMVASSHLWYEYACCFSLERIPHWYFESDGGHCYLIATITIYMSIPIEVVDLMIHLVSI